MNEYQKNEFKRLSDLLLDANSTNEVNMYSKQIHELLDEVDNQKGIRQKRFNNEQLKEYDQHKEDMLAADSVEDIIEFKGKIVRLIDESDSRVK